MFLDRARISVKSGNGGNGFVGFRREKYVPAGGPAGGDGGRGGSVFFRADANLSTLIDFKYRKSFKAKDGEHGQKKNQYGKDADDLIILVPPGTIVKHGETGEVIADLARVGQQLMIARGGRGGRGNTHFATPTRQAPTFAEKGREGNGFWIDLELKLIADAGLVGYPNAGKSTLISVVSAARPKIANYPFTTLIPNLGVVSLDTGRSFVLADIPGLIEGAHEGVGLGTDFLRHVERTRVIVHVIDVAAVDGRDPVEDYKKINQELVLFNERLGALPQIVVANKMDLPEAQENFERLVAYVSAHDREVFAISAATNRGTTELMNRISQVLTELKALEPPVAEVDDLIIYHPEVEKSVVEDFTIRREAEEFVVEGAGLIRLIGQMDLENDETMKYLQGLFEKIGLYRKLREAKVTDGCTVRVGDLEFEFQE